MKINMEWLKQNGACPEAFPYASKIGELEGAVAVRRLMADNHLDWANWLLVRIIDDRQRVMYAIYAAEQVLHIFEEKFRDDDRPRKAIEAAKKCATTTAAASIAAAFAASAASAAAASSAFASSSSAFASSSSAAAFAASAASSAAADAAFFAASSAAFFSSASAASYAAAAAFSAASSAFHAHEGEKIRLQILEYGLDLLEAKGGKSEN